MTNECVYPFIESGVLRVSEAALEKLREFVSDGRLWLPNVPRLPAFVWADGNRVRQLGTNEWRELGPCLTLDRVERRKVPANCVHVVDGFEFVVSVRSQVYEFGAERLIDVDDAAPTGFVLR
jgi:hypothetical protein